MELSWTLKVCRHHLVDMGFVHCGGTVYPSKTCALQKKKKNSFMEYLPHVPLRTLPDRFHLYFRIWEYEFSCWP